MMTRTYITEWAGQIEYYKDSARNIMHREDGPAFIGRDGSEAWYQNGKLHRIGGPAMTWLDGSNSWWLHGAMHRVGGPAQIDILNGINSWYQKGKLHREDGPAQVWENGNEQWRIHGVFHRVDGPALIHVDGTEGWFLFGKRKTQEQVNSFAALLREETSSIDFRETPYDVLESLYNTIFMSVG